MLNIGMIGTGRIADRFVYDCAAVGEVNILAVYNPHADSAEKFINRLGIKECVPEDDLWHFLSMPIGAVYIAVPHELHYEYAKKALEAGKHVLCEKPMCLTSGQVKELYDLAREKGLVLMEAIKTEYCPGFIGILGLVESGKIGEVRDVEACFSRLTSSKECFREIWDSENGGSFTEFGTYTMLPILKLLGKNVERVDYWSMYTPTGVDSYTKATFYYKSAVATAKMGLGVKSEGQLVIAGTKGYILAPSPWWLTKYAEVHYEDPNRIEKYDFEYEGSGLRYEIKAFVNKVEKGELLDGAESVWLSEQMESYLNYRKTNVQKPVMDYNSVKIWAHRGCSMDYPENTLKAFEEAAKLPGITGIELDVQLSADGEIVVIHDETLDRTTTGSGEVRNYTLSELKKLYITGSGCAEATQYKVPTLKEVFELLLPYCKNGLLINIELKNSQVRYEGMEQKVIDLVAEYGLEKNIIYSSFLHDSMGLIKEICPEAKTGILSADVHDCLNGAKAYQADALHPWFNGLDINTRLTDLPVRAWGGGESFFGQPKVLPKRDLREYAMFGVTDIITNVPEMYLY